MANTTSPIKAAKRMHIVAPTTLDPKYRKVLTSLIESTEKNTPDIVTIKPTASTLGEREFRFYYDGTNFWIYTNRNGTIYKTQLNPA